MNNRSLGPLRGPTSSWRPFGPALGPSGLLDFVLHALRALRPCDPRLHPSQANTITQANTIPQADTITPVFLVPEEQEEEEEEEELRILGVG